MSFVGRVVLFAVALVLGFVIAARVLVFLWPELRARVDRSLRLRALNSARREFGSTA